MVWQRLQPHVKSRWSQNSSPIIPINLQLAFMFLLYTFTHKSDFSGVSSLCPAELDALVTSVTTACFHQNLTLHWAVVHTVLLHAVVVCIICCFNDVGLFFVFSVSFFFIFNQSLYLWIG